MWLVNQGCENVVLEDFREKFLCRKEDYSFILDDGIHPEQNDIHPDLIIPNGSII